MPKSPSEATQLRTAKAALTRLQLDYLSVVQQRDAFRVRAEKAEKEAAEWKDRFDLLLRRDTDTEARTRR